MRTSQLLKLENNPTSTGAIIGGGAAFILMSYNVAIVGGGTSYPLEVVFFGSLIAGAFARRNGGRSKSAGITAAVLAVLPMSLLVSTPINYIFETYSIYGVVMATGLVMLFGFFLIFVSVVTGGVGGSVGGWIGQKFAA